MKSVLRSVITLLLAACLASLVPGIPGPTLAADSHERFWQAARDGDVATVRKMLAAGMDVNAKTQFECTALIFAANANRAGVIRVLVEAGADLDAKDNSYGFTAMQMASWLGHTEAVQALLDGGVGPDDAIGAFFAAATNGHAETVKAIVDRELVPKAQLDAGLATAIGAEADDVADVLRKAGASAPEKPQEKQAETQASDTKEPPATKPDPYNLKLDKPVKVWRAANWPEFRGARRSGTADGQHPPVAWDLASSRNVAWKVPIEGLGFSSPVIWDGRVYITTAASSATEQTIDDGGLGWIAAVEETVEHRWELHAYELRSGKLLWKRIVRRGVPQSQRHWKGSQANPTCATDGRYVIASFGSEGLFAYDMDGKAVWSKQLGELNAGWYLDPTFQWGYASSPTIDGDRLFLQVDVHGDSFVAAYELASGKELWRTRREEIPSWGTPLVHRNAKHAELVLNASGAVVGYDPSTGKELWRVRGNSPITVASPIGNGDLIYATGGYKQPKPIYAVRAGARGDVTPAEDQVGKATPALAWNSQTDGVYIVTPLVYRGVIYLCKNNGVLTAYDAGSGEKIYRERLPGSFTASPVAADGHIYFTSEEGHVIVLQAGREFKTIATSELDSAALATPAISDGHIVFRTVKQLIGVGFPQRQALVE